MTPTAFAFKLTVPTDPAGATVVALIAAHAVEYAQIESGAGAAFVERVRITAAEALKSATEKTCQTVFAAADGQLTVTIGATKVSQPLP